MRLYLVIVVALICMCVVGAPVQPQSAIPTPVATQPSAWVAFERAWANVTAYSATVAVFEREGTQVQSTVLDYTFRKPSSATVHFDAGANAGVTVVWNGGDTVVAHRGSGLAALFKKTFPLHDPQVTTIRGSSIDQLSFAAILAHSQGTPGIVSQEAGPAILDIPTEAITLIPTSSVANAGLTREVVDISVPTSLPLRVLGYVGDTLVRQVDFSNIKLQP
jgi:outer membrane lipoprotein-sorting protein